WIAFNRPPALVWVMIQNREFNFLHRSLVGWRRAGVVDNPVSGLVPAKVCAPQKNHDVVGKLLHPGLIEEKQIAGLGLMAIAANELRIETLERSCVGEFRESSVGQLAVFVTTKSSAKQLFTQRSL